LTIVGVGASAGGLEAFSDLLAGLPRNPGIAIVFVQHLAPHHDSALPTLLAAHTAMPVIQVTSGVSIKPDHVYVIPPNVQMELVDGTLELSPRVADHGRHTPINTFFGSLATIAGGRAIAVVLSGTASDGAAGIRDVKAAGGITIVQTPASAKYDGMPKAAIATGMVDLVLAPSAIGAELVQIAAHPYARARARPSDDTGPRDDQLKEIFALLLPISGVDFRHYKQPTIRRRLLRRMVLHRVTEVDRYIELLKSDPAEARSLFGDLLIHVTRFFREPDSFEALTARVFPKLIEDRGAEQPIRCWICGCSTGEEAYSLAIALHEFLQREHSDLRAQIFATDISESAIEHARAGLYPASIAEEVAPERLRRYFTASDGHYQVSRLIRDMCVFARQDITRDPPFSRLDIIFCRNVLIYMDAQLQKKLITVFHYALNPGGHLLLGQAETVGGQADLFALVDKKHRIHRKKSSSHAAPVLPVRVLTTETPRKRVADAAAADSGLQAEVSRAILDRYTPAAVVVDTDLQIVQFRGQTGAFLEPSPGEASLNLLKMAREGLLYGLRTAIHTVRKTKRPVRKAGLQIRTGNGWAPVAIEVVPLLASGRLHYLVTFEQRKAEPAGDPPSAARRRRKGAGRPAADDRKVLLLERELAASRDYLQSIIQELEAANQELQSTHEESLSSNEELQSTNEELDTAKEELQSTNEELNTVNEELQSRNDELSRVNSDLINLVASVQIAIVIVGGDLRIRRFTPMAEKVLNLIPADLNRSISHINPNIECPHLDQLIVECMDTMTSVERDVQDRQGRWYSLRIRPYKALDNKIDGAVLTLFDVDLMKRSEQRAELAREFAESVMLDAAHPMAVLAGDLRVRYVNPPFARLLSLSPEEMKGRMLGELAGPPWQLEQWGSSAGATPGTVLPAVTIPPDGKGRRQTALRINGRVAPSPDGESTVVLVSVTEGVLPARERG